jgi:hypothetical protein
VVHKVDWGNLPATLSRANGWYLAAAVAVTVVGNLVVGPDRWRLILAPPAVIGLRRGPHVGRTVDDERGDGFHGLGRLQGRPRADENHEEHRGRVEPDERVPEAHAGGRLSGGALREDSPPEHERADANGAAPRRKQPPQEDRRHERKTRQGPERQEFHHFTNARLRRMTND